MNLAIIPARGGSKRIPRKNIKSFAGKPIIAYSILAAQESGCFDRVVVSTDDEDIRGVAISYGAEAPFVRPTELSDDMTPTTPVIAHAVKWLNEIGVTADNVCCIYATAPFLSADDLRRGLEVLECGDCNYAVSVTSYSFPIQRALRLTPDSWLEMFDPRNSDVRSQDLGEAWHDAGQFYWGKANAWLSHQPPLASMSKPVILPRYRVQDIDTEEDWILAEYMRKALARDSN